MLSQGSSLNTPSTLLSLGRPTHLYRNRNSTNTNTQTLMKLSDHTHISVCSVNHHSQMASRLYLNLLRAFLSLPLSLPPSLTLSLSSSRNLLSLNVSEFTTQQHFLRQSLTFFFFSFTAQYFPKFHIIHFITFQRSCLNCSIQPFFFSIALRFLIYKPFNQQISALSPTCSFSAP